LRKSAQLVRILERSPFSHGDIDAEHRRGEADPRASATTAERLRPGRLTSMRAP
jgi:hypothetical protein